MNHLVSCNIHQFTESKFTVIDTKNENILTWCLALNGNKIKHYIPEMKADIKLC